ncbi:MAG: respiratory chain complex I subunit 1 family protein [Chitinophagaceae bacterium]
MIGIGTIVTFAASLIFPGILVKTKAKLEGRKGPGLLQPLYDIVRSLRKGSVYSQTTSIIFQVAPIVYLASVLTATLFIPFGEISSLLSFEVDFVFFAYLLAIGKFLMIIGAMDTGSGFEGMGANREALYSMLVEPAFFILMGSMALLTNSVSFHDFFMGIYANSNLTYLLVIVGIFLLLEIALVENSRLPVDDPKTHLELTMVHEVMVLDNSGFDLGLINYTTALKFAIYGSLIANFIIPINASFVIQLGVFFVTQIAFAVIIGISESFRARNKMVKNPQWILTLSAISLIVFLAALILTHKIILS